MSTYAVIEIGGEQLVVEPGRFYGTRNSTLLDLKLGPSARILSCRVLMVCRGSSRAWGQTRVKGAVIQGRVLGNRRTRHGVDRFCKAPTRRATWFSKTERRQRVARFVVDNISGKEDSIPALAEW